MSRADTRRGALPILAKVAITCALAPALLIGAQSGTAGAAATPNPSGSWLMPNADLANTRDATGATITSSNVSGLREAWSFRLPGKVTGVKGVGSLSATPIVEGGVVYIQDLAANVYAISLTTGKLIWEYRVDSPLKESLGPDGVAVANGVVYGDSPKTVFALSATKGKAIWVDRHLLPASAGPFGIQPQVVGGRVYLATALGRSPHGGVLLALNAANGALLWRFDTLLESHPGVPVAGGAWETPLVGDDGSVTYGTGNPYQLASSAVAHPTKLLYTDSDVNLDAATGKLRWYFQGVPDDFKDYDLQNSPISTTVNGIQAVIGSGKMGYVYALNAATGTVLWKTPVGKHNGHDNDSALLVEHKKKLKMPLTFLPGSLGGVLTNMSVANGSVYVASVDYPFRLTSLSQGGGVNAAPPPHSRPSGEVEALNLSTGAVEWDTKFSTMPLGATTVSNDLVFTTLYSGKLVAMEASTGVIVHEQQLPTSTNSSIAIAGNTVLVPDGDPIKGKGVPQLLAYTVATAG